MQEKSFLQRHFQMHIYRILQYICFIFQFTNMPVYWENHLQIYFCRIDVQKLIIFTCEMIWKKSVLVHLLHTYFTPMHTSTVHNGCIRIILKLRIIIIFKNSHKEVTESFWCNCFAEENTMH